MKASRMFSTYIKLSFIIFLAMMLFLGTQAKSNEVLFEEALTVVSPNTSESALRSRSVIVGTSQLAPLDNFSLSFRGTSAAAVSETDGSSTQEVNITRKVTLNLFDDVIVDAKLTNTYKNRSGSTTWVGKINDVVDGTAAFVVNNGQVYGAVDIPGQGNFSIRPGLYGSHIIEEVNNNLILTGESDAVIPKADAARSSSQANGSVAGYSVTGGATVEISNDDGSIIDVYVAYDQDTAGGSVTAITAQSLAELFIAYTNQAYENSGIKQRVWLVGAVDGFNWTNSGEGSDLTAAKEGSIIGLHTKRDENHADLVMFFRPITSPTCSGLAYLQTTNGDVNWQDQGFAVMQACTFGSSIFAHELGHNMGSRHDWYVDDGVTPQTYAHGYIDTVNQFRTIMSYGNRCSALGGSCSTVAHFSNPSVNYNGQTTGIAGGTSTACAQGASNPAAECDADNARNFNEKAVTTAQFRESKVVWTGAIDNRWSTAGNWISNRGAPGATTTVSQVPRSYDNVLIPSGLGNYPTISTTAEARELSIASGATLNMIGGTLTVGWAWEDAGGFNASGGTVKFTGPIGVTLTSSSSFNNVEIGAGSDTTEVTLDSNLDVNGNFTIKAGATFKAGNYQVNIAGNFSDHISGFSKGTSTVIFDGTVQTVDKTTTAGLLTEDFNAYTSCGCKTAAPSGWERSGDGLAFMFGKIGDSGEVIQWSNSTDAWLFSPALELSPNTDYTLKFDYLKGSGSSSFSMHYGTSQTSAAMTVNLSSLSDAEITTSYQNKAITFTVPTAGTYYLGFNGKQTGSYNKLDNITLDGTSVLQFHDVKITSGETAFLKSAEVANDLQISAGATVDFALNGITVEGAVINDGEIKQTRVVDAGINAEFASIKSNADSTDKYFGVEINPTTSLGNTTVSVKGNQTCASGTGFVSRCYSITPTTTGTAAIRFYHRAAELNENSAPIIKIQSGSDWTDAPTTISRGGSGDGSWVSGTGLTATGVFGLDDLSVTDSTPDSFTFINATGVALGSVQTSNAITVTGINTAAPISVTGGTYRINGGASTTAAGTVRTGDTVTVSHTASVTPGTAVETTLTIGGVSATFSSTTVGADTTPEAFTFINVTGVALGSVQTSNAITVTGINTAAPISVTGGTYRINGGTSTTAAGTVRTGDTVTVSHTASATPGTAVETTLTIGGVSATFSSTTVGADTTPEAFTFINATGVALGSVQTSNAITVTGINTAAPISVTGGTYRINGGASTTAAGTVRTGDTVTVSHTASVTPGTAVETTLTIGGVSATFSSTTVGADTIPNVFIFTDVADVELSSIQTSNAITVTGINTATPISVTGGVYSINDGAYTGTMGIVNNGNTVTVRHTASATYGVTVDTVLTIGGVSDTFTSTVILDNAPDEFSFPSPRNTTVQPGDLVESNSIIIAGLSAPVAIAISNGEYSINSGGFTSETGTVSNGDVIIVRHISSSLPAGSVTSTLSVGSFTTTFTSTTVGEVVTIPETNTSGNGGGSSVDILALLSILFLTILIRLGPLTNLQHKRK